VRVLLTGAAGFIGGHISSALVERGHAVVGIDDFLSSAHGESPEIPLGIERLDVRTIDAVEQALGGVDVVCHQAAVVGAGVDMEDAPAYASHNDLGTAVLLAAMQRTGCLRLVLASSMVVYGDGLYRCEVHGRVGPEPRSQADLERGVFDPQCPHGDGTASWELVGEEAPARPRSLYAASKLAQENYALAWSLATGGSVTALRYHNVYGELMPRDTPYSGVAAMFRSSLEAGEPPGVFEDGRQARDFVHVRDVAQANVLALEAALPGFVPLNICSGRPITIHEVALELSRARHGPAPAVTGQFRPGDVRHIVADPARARALLGFEASIPPTEGLANFASAPLRNNVPSGPPRV
jgi:dTDP-L-rhamnose 4-epimerase